MGRFWIKYEYLYTRSERYYEALDTFSNNILRLIFYQIKNIHTLKIWKCSLHLQRNVGLPKLYLTRRLKPSKALSNTCATLNYRSHSGGELATSYPGSFHYAPRWRKDPGPGWSRVSQILGDNNIFT
jgi:hypothetical protein